MIAARRDRTKKNQKEKKKQGAYRRLRNEIFSGLYWPRQRLVEAELSKKLAVNRAIVRDILNRLTLEGLVVTEPYKGSFVAEISVEDAHQTYQVEAFLEGCAAFLATTRIKPKKLKELESLIIRSKRLDNSQLGKWERLNREIHKIVIKACGNEKLIDMIRKNVKFNNYWFVVLSPPGEIKRRNEKHELMLDAMTKGNAEMARHLMETHILEAAEDLRKELERRLPMLK